MNAKSFILKSNTINVLNRLISAKNLDVFVNQTNFYQTNPNSNNLFKWLNEKVGIDLKEVRLNFNYFRKNVKNIPFALIQLDTNAIQNRNSIEELGKSLAVLHQNDMKTILILGQSLDSKTDFSTLKEYKQINENLMADFVDQFSKFNLKAVPIFNGNTLFECKQSDKNKLFGEITNVDLKLIKNCFQSDQLPIIGSIGESKMSNNYLYLDTNNITHSLALTLNPFKIIKLNENGGLKDEKKKLILNINIPKNNGLQFFENHKNLLENAGVSLNQISSLLASMPSHASYVITDINSMIVELFTNVGQGTFFKISESVLRFNGLDKIDINKIKLMIESSFKKKLKDDYFEKLAKRDPVFFITENYSALAIVTREFNDYAYLDKFCVDTQHQGHGLADLLWDEIKKDYKGLFWRSKSKNPINSWYFRRAQGSWNTNNWILFWYGINDPFISTDLIKYSLELEVSFVENNTKIIKLEAQLSKS